MPRLNSIVEAVGNTPLVRLREVAREVPDVKVLLKLEYANPGGSVKDRPALQIIQDAIADGRLTRDKILIDAKCAERDAPIISNAAITVRS